MRRVALTDDEFREAHAEYMSGVFYADVARHFGVSQSTLERGFRRLGLPRRPAKGTSKPRILEREGLSFRRVKPTDPYGLYIRFLLR